MIRQHYRALYVICIVFLLELLALKGNANFTISGTLEIDTSWSPAIYLSIIPDFEQLNAMSNQMIIDKSDIDQQGNFTFQTDYLPSENYLYRIHLPKKGDPPASLIIGGKDENHMFLVANKESTILIKNRNLESVFGTIEFTNSPQSQLLNEINKMVLFFDTTKFNSSLLKRELVENALYEKIRQFADTCSFPLVALYAIYKTNFESNVETNPDFYKRFLAKWVNENSPYFKEFRKKIHVKNQERNYSFLFGILGLIIGMIFMILIFKIKTQKSILFQKLTIQERKIFYLLQSEKSNKEISDELNISLSTVKSHVNNIFSKLNIKSRKEVVNIDG